MDSPTVKLLASKLRTARRARFAEEYVLDRNAAAAYIRAGYSRKAAQTEAPKLLRDPRVQQAIEELSATIRKAHNVTVDRVVQELARIAFSDIGDLFDANGDLLPPDRLSEDARRAVASFKVSGPTKAQPDTVVEVRAVDKLRGLEQLGRYLGMFQDKLELSGSVDLAERIRRARSRTNG